ncbi:MAG: hypothetical protein ABJB74_05740 [Gemmatimonas sp.]
MLVIRVVALAIVVAVATYFVGWICVPIIGAVYAIAIRRSSAPVESALAALLGWGALLAWVSFLPAFTALLAKLGGIFPLPGVGVAVLTLVFAVALAWSSARIVSAVVVRG